jgi:hypothetical protein
MGLGGGMKWWRGGRERARKGERAPRKVPCESLVLPWGSIGWFMQGLGGGLSFAGLFPSILWYRRCYFDVIHHIHDSDSAHTCFPTCFGALLDTHAALDDAEQQLGICPTHSVSHTHGRDDDSLCFRVGSRTAPQVSVIFKQKYDKRVPAPLVPLLFKGSARSRLFKTNQ